MLPSFNPGRFLALTLSTDNVQVDVDISSSSVAANITNLVAGACFAHFILLVRTWAPPLGQQPCVPAAACQRRCKLRLRPPPLPRAARSEQVNRRREPPPAGATKSLTVDLGVLLEGQVGALVGASIAAHCSCAVDPGVPLKGHLHSFSYGALHHPCRSWAAVPCIGGLCLTSG